MALCRQMQWMRNMAETLVELLGFQLLDDGQDYQLWARPSDGTGPQVLIRRKSDGHSWCFPRGETSQRIVYQVYELDEQVHNRQIATHFTTGIDYYGHQWTIGDPNSLLAPARTTIRREP